MSGTETKISIEALRKKMKTHPLTWPVAEMDELVEAVEALNKIAECASYAKSTDDLSDVWRTFMAIAEARDGVLARFDFGSAS